MVIQRTWRKRVMLDVGRKSLLYKRWDDKKAAMGALYRQKGRKYVHVFRAVKDLQDTIRDKVMSAYYITMKRKYLLTFVKWLRKREVISRVSPNVVIFFG